jgi:hypothetical protein
VAKKGSNFAGSDFDLYSKKKKREIGHYDLASTIAAVLGINTPRQNQGSFIDEIVELGSISEDEKKLIYLDYRQQQQQLLVKFANSKLFMTLVFNNKSEHKELEALKVLYRNPDVTTAEFYYNEVNMFKSIVKLLKEERAISENSYNSLYAYIVAIFVIFFTIMIIQYLTFANFIAVFKLSSDESSRQNKVIFILASLSFLLFILISSLFSYLIDGNKISAKNFSFDFISAYVIIPTFIAFALFKLGTYTFISANIIMNRPSKKGIKITFFLKNLFCGLNQGVIKENGLQYIYLFRIYTLLIITIVSMLLLLSYGTNSYLFSSDTIAAFLIYKDDSCTKALISMNSYLILTTVYLFVYLFFFFNYPTFNRFKQVFDSLFTLYDSKLVSNVNLEHEPCEKEALESRFSSYFTNFDTQSELYYITLYHATFNHMVYSEVIFC